MGDAYIQVAPDSTGKKMQTVENTVSGNSVHAEAVLLVDANGVPIGSPGLPTGAATEAKQDTQITDLGGVTETAPASDTASSGLNGRLQRIAQRLTSLIALLPASLGQKVKAASLAVTMASDQDALPVSGTVELGATSLAALENISVTVSSEVEVKNDTGSAIPISAASLPLPTGAATEATLDARTGSLTETAPATDTASSGINGRLQRIAQRITSLIALFPSSIGQKAKAASLAVALPTDQVGTALIPSADILSVQRPSITEVRSTAFEASHILKASAGQLVQLSVFNSGVAQFILLINATTLPANGAVTLLYPPIPIAKETLLVLDLPAPLVASTGIVVCNSSTGSFTKTIGAADLAIYAQVN